MSLGEQLWGYGGDPYEDNGNFPGLQFNPAPGVPQAVSDLVEDLNRAQKNITSASETLHNIGDGDWTGTAAEAFRAKTQALPKLLDDAGKSFELAHGVLQKWQNQLGAMQSKAHAYEAEAKTARKRAERAERNDDLNLFRFGGIGMTDEEAADAKQRYSAALNELGTAREELSGIVSSANNIRSQHEELAGTVASVLKLAAEQAPKEPGFFDNLKNGLEQLVKDHEALFHAVGRWAQEHANAIAAIGDVLSTLSTLTGLVGFCFPPAEEVMAPISGLSSLAAFALHKTAQGFGGKDVVSDRTLLEDELGIASFGLSKGATVAEKVGGAVLGEKVDELSKAAGWGSTGKTVVDWKHDLTSLGYFLPHNAGEALAVGGSLLLGGTAPPLGGLVVAFKHAWENGSEKDSAAARQQAG
ncbi:hypothetical protein O1L44_11405 [Streptomyces noursei]|uniref:putative T7SS-secreted protein n=1 Tax=Streptomyces noursei TaxID=1971 RepID=UPI00081C8258|nr:hypothetical protein SNOUR_16120 [Streptomyces noursei ATCC 11455]MCZ0993596.1 hypothetical protein [Streptomyces noursei]